MEGGYKLKVNEKEYMLEFFKENGFIRKKGNKCPEYFWTLNPELEEPQDTPCIEYRFEKIKSIENLSVSEARKLFIQFFEKHGHTPLKPRPVVARWREDLYLTIASIVVFQPHVTSGLVPPPANPLVISQPSIRLEDIDNVGLTIGRHLTSFEMAAHHAFNYPDKFIYWKNETVRLAYEFFTEYMKIPPEEIVFKESWWEGGGNAGPSFEVVVGGIELATLVFMKYKVDNGSYTEIPLKIVDTGYGVERLAWFTQKTPTAFHSIFQDLLDKFRSKINVEEVDESILWAAFKEAGRLDPEDPVSVQSYYKRIAKRTGLDINEIIRALEKEARLYSILDHTRTLALMLGDGIVPSNTGEGYLARLVARRTLKQLRLLDAEVNLAELVELQVDYWKNDFPQMAENKSYIIDAVLVEEEKFKEVLAKGEQLVKKIIKKKKTLDLEDLIKLYDSNGLPPEIVADILKSRGITITIPHNFYSLVASRHQAPAKIRKIGEKTSLPPDIITWAGNLPPTRKLYYENQYMREFTAKPIAWRDKYLVLDQTVFYPKGGGQDHDTGVIECNGEVYRVERVEKVGDVVVHVLDKQFNCRHNVVGRIDWPRRYRLMRHHTGTHVILGALRRVLGNHVWQAGAEKTIEKGRLDFTHHRPLTKEQIREIERLANKVIDDRRKVKVMYLPRNEAEEKYGFIIYQGGVPMQATIRLLEIEDWDIEGCGGTHLANTGEIGGLKIINVDKIQDGVIRIEYVAGTRLAEHAQEQEDTLLQLAETLRTSPQQLTTRLSKILEESEMYKSKLTTYRKLYYEMIESRIKTTDDKVVIIEFPENDRKAMQEILRKLTMTYPDKIIGLYYKQDHTIQLEVATGDATKLHLGKTIKELANRIGARGGGSKTYASLRLAEDKLQTLKQELEKLTWGTG